VQVSVNCARAPFGWYMIRSRLWFGLKFRLWNRGSRWCSSEADSARDILTKRLCTRTLGGEVWVALGITVRWETEMTYNTDDVKIARANYCGLETQYK